MDQNDGLSLSEAAVIDLDIADRDARHQNCSAARSDLNRPSPPRYGNSRNTRNPLAT
jgi:hypothetical protein